MVRILKMGAIAFIVCMGVGMKKETRELNASLTLSEWNIVFNALEYRKQLLISSTEPARVALPMIDTLARIQGSLNMQLSKAIYDTIKPSH